MSRKPAQQISKRAQQPAEPWFHREVIVIDPTSRYGKLHIPMSYTFETQGLVEWRGCEGNLKKDLSLCCLFQRGKCHVGERCFQVHVDRTYVTELRGKYADLTTCCHKCGDVHSNNDEHRRFLRQAFSKGTVAVTFGGSEGVVELSADRLAATTGLDDHARQRESARGGLQIPFSKVCRLHLKNNCKYGKDCKNVHICHKVAEAVLEGEKKAAADKKKKRNAKRVPAENRPTVAANRNSTPPPRSIEVESDDSRCPTPEERSRTNSPVSRRSSVIDSPQQTPEPSRERATIEPVDFLNGVPVSPPKSCRTGVPATVEPKIQLDVLSRFQSQWSLPSGTGNESVSTESLAIIFNGFPGFFSQ